MNKQQITDIALESIRDEKRKGKVIQLASVLDSIPNLLSAIEIDKQYLYSCVSNALNRTNPINSILRIFGLKLIRENDEQRLVKDGIDGDPLRNALVLNETELKKTISQLGDELSEIEKEHDEQSEAYIKKINELTKELDELQMKNAQCSREYEMAVGAVADRLQYIFSVLGNKSAEDPVEAQLNELLTDLGMSLMWDDTAEDKNAGDVKFQVLKVENPTDHRAKPCIISGGQVLKQGVKFVAVE